MEEAKKTIITFFVNYGKDVAGALIILAVGLFVARWLGRLLERWLERIQMEPPVRLLLVRVARLLVIAFTALAVLEKFGVPTTSAIAGIGVAGLGVGLAMQGVLSNVVAGLTIIFTKPFRVGEYIELIGVQGQVTTIELFTTTLAHADLSKVVIPNRKIVGEVLHNYGNIRQLDLSVGISYSADLNKVLSIVNDILSQNPRLLKDPAPGVGIKMLADSSITIAIRPWTTVPNYGPAGAEIYTAVIERFRANKIEIPFPQHEVRLLNNATAVAA